jgi:hypothetical protein
MTYACPAWELKTAAFTEQISLQHWLIGEIQSDLQVTCGIQNFLCLWCNQWSEIIQNHQNPNVHAVGQGRTIRMRCKGFKLGSNEAYDHSSD